MVTDFSEVIAAFVFWIVQELSTLKMKAASFCGTSLTMHQPTRRSIWQTLICMSTSVGTLNVL
jgi:hypothetical protein